MLCWKHYSVFKKYALIYLNINNSEKKNTIKINFENVQNNREFFKQIGKQYLKTLNI